MSNVAIFASDCNPFPNSPLVNIQDQPIICQGHRRWKGAIDLCVSYLMSDMREVGPTWSKPFRHINCLLQCEVRGMLSESKGIKHKRIDPLQLFGRLLADRVAVGTVREVANAIPVDPHTPMREP